MTREQAKSFLLDLGIESPNGAQISQLLNVLRDDREQSIADAVRAKEDELNEKFKDYHSKDDYEKVVNEYNALKDSSAKTQRTASYKAKGIKDKWVDYADKILKDEKDFDKALDKFIGENPELVEKKEPTPEPETKPEPKPFEFGGTSSEKGGTDKKYTSYEDAIRADLEARKGK